MNTKNAEQPKKKRYGNVCAVPLCKNIRQGSSHLSWHGFPKDPKDCKEWLRRMRRQGETGKYSCWKPRAFDKICGIHFNRSGKRQYMDKLPIFFPWKEYPKEFSLPNVQKQKKTWRETDRVETVDKACFQNRVAAEIPTTLSDLDIGREVTWPVFLSPSKMCLLMKSFNSPTVETNDSLLHREGTDHSYGIRLAANDENNLDILKEKTNLVNDLLAQNVDIGEKMLKYAHENNELRHKLSQLEKKSSFLEATIKINSCKPVVTPPFQLSDILPDKNLVRFYTGFESALSLVIFVDIVVKAYKSSNEVVIKGTGRPQSLDHREQLFLVLCRLRLGLLETDLAQRFKVSTGTVNRVWSTWISFMSSHLSSVPFRPEVKPNQEHVTETVDPMIDVELFIENSSDIAVQSAKYPSAKRRELAKCLVGITAGGLVGFVSDLHRGGKGKLDKIGKLSRDVGTDDRGSKPLSVDLKLPSFVNGKSQPIGTDLEAIRRSAEFAVHLERVIVGVRRYRILKHILEIKQFTYVNEVWKICCFLNNFTSDPKPVLS